MRSSDQCFRPLLKFFSSYTRMFTPGELFLSFFAEWIKPVDYVTAGGFSDGIFPDHNPPRNGVGPSKLRDLLVVQLTKSGERSSIIQDGSDGRDEVRTHNNRSLPTNHPSQRATYIDSRCAPCMHPFSPNLRTYFFVEASLKTLRTSAEHTWRPQS